MVAQDSEDPHAIIEQLRAQLAAGEYRVTQHAQQEMVADQFLLDDVLYAVRNAELLENYPSHRRGACGLVGGVVPDGRPNHIVCTTRNPVTIITTVYEPKPPRWITPRQRGSR